MAIATIENHKQKILFKLEQAGAEGLTKSGLGIKSPKTPSGRALKELEQAGQIGNLGSRNRTRYVLREHFNLLELACERIESAARSAEAVKGGALDLMTRTELEKACKGAIGKKAGEAVDWLVKEGRLIRFRRGRLTYYLHVGHLSDWVPQEPVPQSSAAAEAARPAIPPAEAPEVLRREQVLDAYDRVKHRIGYSNVPIYELQMELGVPFRLLKAHILEESRRGNAVLSVGDWSLSSEEIRSGVIEIGGYRYLLVRFLQ
jgi:hypothetical protein